MYVDGIILLVIYVMAASGLMLSVLNYIENKDLRDRLNRRSKPSLPPTYYSKPQQKTKTKGHWG